MPKLPKLKRFSWDFLGMEESGHGVYVFYMDYKRVKDELDALKKKEGKNEVRRVRKRV